jgi:hypothetical protein
MKDKHCIKIDDVSIENVEELKYFGKTLTNQNSIQEEIKSSEKIDAMKTSVKT